MSVSRNHRGAARAAIRASRARCGLLLCVLLLGLVGSGRAAARGADERTEVTVRGPKGGRVRLDGRPVGALPLARPLRCAPGPHQVRLEAQQEQVEAVVEVQAGRPVEIRFSTQPPLALVSYTEAAVLALDAPGVPEVLREPIRQAAGQGAARERVVVLQSEPAQPARARYVLSLRLELSQEPAPVTDGPPPAPLDHWRFSGQLHEVNMGVSAAAVRDHCLGCDTADLLQWLRSLVSRLVREGVTRPRGSLALEVTPADARVRLDGRDLREATGARDVYAGAHEVQVERAGYLPHRRVVRVAEDEEAQARVVLEPVPAERPPPVAQRPALATRTTPLLLVAQPAPLLARPTPPGRGAWVLLGVGVVAAVVGGTLWGSSSGALDDLSRPGIAALLSGAVITGGAGLLLHLEQRRARP